MSVLRDRIHKKTEHKEITVCLETKIECKKIIFKKIKTNEKKKQLSRPGIEPATACATRQHVASRPQDPDV